MVRDMRAIRPNGQETQPEKWSDSAGAGSCRSDIYYLFSEQGVTVTLKGKYLRVPKVLQKMMP